MRFKERDASSKRKYSKISVAKRLKLIQMVIEQGESLIKTTRKLNINLSTARLILKLYRETGNFHMKNFRHPPKETHPPAHPPPPTPPQQPEFPQNEVTPKIEEPLSSTPTPQADPQTENPVPWQWYWMYFPFFTGA